MNNKGVIDSLIENMGNMFRGGAKLNLVFASIVIILAGIVFYLVYNEKRIKNLEDKLKNK